jgi:hypothetical protein
MSKIKVFIDTSIYIAWLNKESEYNNIDKIIKFIQDGKIEVVSTLDVKLEVIQGVKGFDDWEKVVNNFKPIIHYLTPNFIIGDNNGSYKAHLDKSTKEWQSLSSLIKNNRDTKHFISGKNLGAVKYFLALDNKFLDRIQDQGKDFLATIQLVKPSDFIQILNNRL